MHSVLLRLLYASFVNVSIVLGSRFLAYNDNRESTNALLTPDAEIKQLQASIASLQVKLWAATNKTAALKARESQYITDLRANWKARADKVSGYQQRQVDLDAGFDKLRAQYAKTNAECQQHLGVHQQVKQQILRLALGQQSPADYVVGAAILPAGVSPGGPVIVPTASGPMLVTPGPEVRVGEAFQFLYPLHPSKATNAAVVHSGGAPSHMNAPVQSQKLQKPNQQQLQQPQKEQHVASVAPQAFNPQTQPAPVPGVVMQPVPPLPLATVSDPGDFPAGWPKAQWRLNFTYADILRSPWQKWLAHEVVADEPPTPAPKKTKSPDGPSRYELLKLETQLKWQLKIEESSVGMYENLMTKYEAMTLRADVNSQGMKQHIQASEANYGETGSYLKAEIAALEAMCDAAQDLSSPGAQGAVTQMASAPQSFGILSRQAQLDQQTMLERTFVLGAKHCVDEYEWRRTDVQHWEQCALLCSTEAACEGFRFTLVSMEENCQLTDSCGLGSNRATAFEESHWQTFFRSSTSSSIASQHIRKGANRHPRIDI